jgi:hypothetical protein
MNNPLRYFDPSGHWPWPPAGNQIQLNWALGLNIGPAFLAYGSVSLVTDNKGGIQVYYTKRDQDYHEGSSDELGGFEPGPAEQKYPTSMLAIGEVSLSYGAISGEKFENEGTVAYADQAVGKALGLGPIQVDYYYGFNKDRGEADPEALEGFDIGFGWGGPFTIGSISTKAIPKTDRIQLPSSLIPICKSIGMCGSIPRPIFTDLFFNNHMQRSHRGMDSK